MEIKISRVFFKMKVDLMFDDVRLWTCGHARMLKEKFSNSQ